MCSETKTKNLTLTKINFFKQKKKIVGVSTIKIHKIHIFKLLRWHNGIVTTVVRTLSELEELFLQSGIQARAFYCWWTTV